VLTRARITAVTLATILAPLIGSVSGCGSGCGAELHVEPVMVRGNGKPRVDLDLFARITDDGEPVEGVDIEFFGIGPDGVILGDATSGPDGVAHLRARGAVGPESLFGDHADQWTAYRARVSYLQGGDEAAARTICAKQADAPFHFEP
jgi:hypothetical protein